MACDGRGIGCRVIGKIPSIVWRYFPETKGVTLEEMQRRLGIVDDVPQAALVNIDQKD